MLEINALIARLIERTPRFISLAETLAEAIAHLPLSPLTLDQLKMLKRDTIVSPDAETLAAFGLAATPIETVAMDWLAKFQKLGRFARQRRAA